MPGPVLVVIVAVLAVGEVQRDALARYGLGLWQARNELPVQAVRQFETAAKANPTSPEPLRPLVTAYAELGRHAAAIRTARKVLELDPADAGTSHTLGQLYFEAKRYRDSVTALRQAADSPRIAKEPARRFGILRDLGRACEAANDGAGAEAALRAAIAVASDQGPSLGDPPDVDRSIASAQESLGKVLESRRQFAGAERAYAEAARRYTAARSPMLAARLDWNRSGLLAAEGKFEEALACLERYLALQPSGPEPYDRYAELLHRLNRNESAVPGLTRLAEANPANESIRWVLAAERGRSNLVASDAMFLDLSTRSDEPALFRYVVRHYRESRRPGPLLALADHHYRSARRPEGETSEPDPARLKAVGRAQALTAAIRADHTFAPVLVRQAADNARQGIEHTDDTWELVAGLAEQTGTQAVIEPALRSALRDGSEVVYRPLVRILTAQRRWEELLAVIDLAKVAQNSRQRPRGRGPRTGYLYDFDRAAPLAELGEAAQAMKALERIKDNAKDPFFVHVERARILNILGRYGESIALCETLHSQASSASQIRTIRLILSIAHQGLKEPAKSEALLRSALDDDPDDALILNNLGYYLSDQGRNLAEAEALIRRAIEIDRDNRARAGDPDPENGTYLDSLGWVLFRRGRLDEARTVLETAARSADAGTDPIVWDHLGDVRFRLRNRTAAREAWTKAAGLYENTHQGRQFGRLDEVRRKLQQTE